MSTNTMRILKEYKKFLESKHQNMFMDINESDCKNIQALVIGPDDTPYEGGFFMFQINAENYPMNPPKVKFVTPDCSSCRLHPNLYAEGKVCLSILGTWGKDEWSPLLSFEKILLTISGLLDKNPIAHEPGFEKTLSEDYAVMARFLTLRTAKSMLSRDTVFKDVINEYFNKNRRIYEKSLEILSKYENKTVSNLHGTYTIKTDTLKNFIKP